jgi:hypothetical protein
MTEPVVYTFAGPWFSAREAQLYVPCKSIKAWHAWKRRHGIITRNNGSVAKADLDRVLRRRKPRRVMHANSLRNLSTRAAAGLVKKDRVAAATPVTGGAATA